jgi:hypothetical protein
VGLEPSVVHDSFALQGVEKTGYVVSDLYGVSGTVPFHERCDNLLQRTLSIAEFQNVMACALHSDHAFWEQHNLLLALSAPTATGCEPGLTGFRRDGHAQDSLI